MKTVIEMARDAGATVEVGMAPVFYTHNELLKFAELVRADEREACAQVCEEIGEESDSFTRDILRSTAAAIRARGKS